MVRPAAPSDAPSIARVHVESWRTTYDGLLPEDHLAALDVADYAGRWERSLSSPFARGAVFVAEPRRSAENAFKALAATAYAPCDVSAASASPWLSAAD